MHNQQSSGMNYDSIQSYMIAGNQNNYLSSSNNVLLNQYERNSSNLNLSNNSLVNHLIDHS